MALAYKTGSSLVDGNFPSRMLVKSLVFFEVGWTI